MYIDRIETEDLILKKASMDDVDDMYMNIWSEEETAKYMLWIPVKSIEEARERMIKTIGFQKGRMAYLVYEKQSGQAIGFAGMKEIEDKVYEDIGIGMGSKFVGRGYGRQILIALVDYCFKELNAVKIICSCRQQNIASEKLQLSCGFHYSRSQEMVDWRDGMRYMLDYYELTREERLGE